MRLIQDLLLKIKAAKRLRLIVALALALILVIIGLSVWRGKATRVSALSSQQRTATAQNGTLSVTLSGSGSVAAGQSKSVSSNVDGTVSESYLEEGKTVKAGDVLLKLETKNAEIELKKLENTVKQQELNVSQQQDQVNSLNAAAPVSGRISGLSVEAGDSVNKGQALCTIVDESKLELRTQFSNISSDKLKNAGSVVVHIPDYSVSLDATIESLVQSGSDTEALIEINNPGALKSGLAAVAEISTSNGDFMSESGTLEWRTQETVQAGVSGTVKSISALDGQYVNQGKTLLSIDNGEAATTLESLLLNLDEAKDAFEQAKANMGSYTITAPFDGTLVSVTDLAAGDSVKANTVLSTLIDTGTMSMEISIDELDISQVTAGQEVSITLDALEETTTTPIEGEVEAVAVEGTTSNGVTSYPVTITFPGMDGLKVGMNADAVIKVINKENVLLVPFEAVQKKGSEYYVWVKGGTTAQSSSSDTATTSSSDSSSDKSASTSAQPSGSQSAQPSGSPPAQPSGSPPMQPSGSPPAQPSGSPPAQPSGSPPANFTGNTSVQQANTSSGKSGTASGQTGSKSSANSYYSGAAQVVVTVGAHNENYMEITSGLNEGDVIVLPQVTESASSSATESTSGQGQGVMMPIGGDTGGPPSGGGPGGGGF